MLKARRLKVLGLMSGTSLDGVDAAVLDTDGTRILGFGPQAYRPYTRQERSVLRVALGQWAGPAVTAAAKVTEAAHHDVIARFDDIDLIGFHGQTLAHDPGGRGTLQVGNGATLADQSGVPVVWDFRRNDVALGGQGAPLAPFYHFACARWMGADKALVFLNLGGVGNLTWIDPDANGPEVPGALLAFDTGPANAPIDDVMSKRLGLPFDRNGAVAATGRIDRGLIEQVLNLQYFSKIPPKSLDRDSFAKGLGPVQALAAADAVASLTALCAATVAAALRHLPGRPDEIWVTGGGRHNPVLMAQIAGACDCPARPVEEAGLDGDMMEAQAFAYLAARHVNGLPISAPGTTDVPVAATGGRLSLPKKSSG